MPGVVLITGVSHYLGSRLAAQLAADPSVERVIGIDTIPPRPSEFSLLGRTEFVRADIRNPLIAKVISQAQVTTVVHAALTASTGARVPMQEMNVIGTMQLLAACQKSDSVCRFVHKSTTAIYGCRASDPAVFTEDMHPMASGQSGYAKDAVEVEGYLRGFARRRPDIELTILRLANVLGPTADSALTRYLAMPVVPTALGFDPRVQLLHESDAIETLRLATGGRRPGVYNVAGDGVMSLAQILRRSGRVRLPVPHAAMGLAGALVRNPGVVDVTSEGAQYLTFGRGIDTTRLRTQFDYQPRYSTAATLESFLEGRSRRRGVAGTLLGVGSRLLETLSDRRAASIEA